MNNETLLCPRRSEGPAITDGPDRWEPGDARWNAQRPWPGPGPAPRTCSFCGGVHPDDVLTLLRDHAWESHGTDKSYKKYLEPPGTRAAHQALMRTGQRAADAPRSPTPPAKVYLQHWTDEQMAHANTLIEARKTAE